MSHTNETPNYKLPLFVDNDVPSWLGDFNEAMNELDTGLGDIKNSNVAQNVAITNLQTTVNGQVTDINNLKSTTEDHTAAIAELHEGLDTAETDIAGKAPISHASTGTGYGIGNATNYGHVRLNDNISSYKASDGVGATAATISAYIEHLFKFEEIPFSLPAGLADSKTALGLVANADRTLFKFYGLLNVTGSGSWASSRVLIPGQNEYYGFKLTSGAGFPKKYMEINTGSIYCNNGSLNSDRIYTNSIIIGSDGELYIIKDVQAWPSNAGGLMFYPACLYVLSNFGDVVNPPNTPAIQQEILAEERSVHD